MTHALREVDAMPPYKSTTQLYNYNYSTTPALQPDDVIASPANGCAANANDEENVKGQERRDLGQVRPPP